MKKNIFQNNGQVLLFAVLAMAIALSLGVAVSTRTLQMSSRVSRTDTSSRVLAAAEGGIDRLLAQSPRFLDTMVAGTPDCVAAGFTSFYYNGHDSTTWACLLNFPLSSDDKIQSRAILSAKNYWFTKTTGNTKFLSLNIDNNQTRDVALTDVDVFRLCWNNPLAAIEYVLYGTTTKRNFLRADNAPVSVFNNTSNSGFVDVSSQAVSDGRPMNYCYDIDISSTNEFSGLRVKSVFANSEVAIVPITPSVLPTQGYRIYSRGELVQDGQVKTTRAVVVYRSLNTFPSFFDNAIFTNGVVPGY